MQETPATPDPAHRHRLLALLLIHPILAALVDVYALDHTKTHRSLLAMTNFVGPPPAGCSRIRADGTPPDD